MIALWIVLGVVALFLLWLWATYNGLVALKNRTDEASSDIDVQTKRRYDLIPNLVETAKGYLKHERETLEAVIAARNTAISGLKLASNNPGDASAMNELSGAETALHGAMNRLSVVMEAYPDLKANENMLQVSEELATTENRLAFARQAFNDAVTEYNSYKQSFPPVIFAGMFGHQQDAKLMEFADSAAFQAAPKVSF